MVLILTACTTENVRLGFAVLEIFAFRLDWDSVRQSAVDRRPATLDRLCKLNVPRIQAQPRRAGRSVRKKTILTNVLNYAKHAVYEYNKVIVDEMHSCGSV